MIAVFIEFFDYADADLGDGGEDANGHQYPDIGQAINGDHEHK